MEKYRIEVNYEGSGYQISETWFSVQVRESINFNEIWVDIKSFDSFDQALELYNLLIK